MSSGKNESSSLVRIISDKISSFVSKGEQRSVQVKKNIIASFFFKGSSLIINLILVPLTIDYVNPVQYGVWLTISSIIGMLNFFDIGLGNGLRNKFAEARAKGQDDLAKEYVSTTYAVLLLISASIFLLFNLVYPFINWSWALNVPVSQNSETGKTFYVVFSFYCFQFVFSLIGTIFTADQKPALSNFFNFLYTFLSLISVYLLTRFTDGSILYLGIAVGGMPALVFLVSSLIFFSSRYKQYKPEWQFVKFHHLKQIAGLGINFFIIQITAIIIFSTGNILISQILSPAEVTPYNIAFRYFGVITMVYSILITPFWTGFTDAWHRNDKEWIKKTMKKLNLISIGILVVLIIMAAASDFVYTVWVGSEIEIPLGLSILMALYVFISAWMTPVVYFMNGIGKLKLQLYLSIFTSIINIPVSIFFTVTMEMGIKGIILGPIICILPYAILMPVQYKKIIEGTAEGIWKR